jgi:hypothetical protein
MYMATKVTLVCDVCGKDTDTATGRFTITVGGKEAEVDLCATHRRPIEGLLASVEVQPVRVGRSPAVDAAKRVTAKRTAKKAAAKKSPAARRTKAKPDPAAVRAWAASNGIEVSPRGMVPTAVVLQFQEAGN